MDDPNMSDEVLSQTLDAVAAALSDRDHQSMSEQVAAGAARIRSLSQELSDINDVARV